MTQTAVFLFLEVGVAIQGTEIVEHFLFRVADHTDAELANEARLVPGLTQQSGVAPVGVFLGDRWCTEGKPVRSLIQSREERGPTRCADGGGHEGISEAHPPRCQRVDDGGLDDGMARTAQRIVALVVCQDEDQIGTRGRNTGTRADQQQDDYE